MYIYIYIYIYVFFCGTHSILISAASRLEELKMYTNTIMQAA